MGKQCWTVKRLFTWNMHAGCNKHSKVIESVLRRGRESFTKHRVWSCPRFSEAEYVIISERDHRMVRIGKGHLPLDHATQGSTKYVHHPLLI